MDNNKLIEFAQSAMSNAYAPYSNFYVGAALLTSDDKVYTGCNIENSSYGATNCAERTAFFKAISEGQKNFKKIAIVSSSNDYTFPCGICLQVMFEFMPDGQIVLYNQNEIKVYSLKQLLPYAFRL